MGNTNSQGVYGNCSLSFNADAVNPVFFAQRGMLGFVRNGAGDYTFELMHDGGVDATEAVMTTGIQSNSGVPLIMTVDPVDVTHFRVRTWLGSVALGGGGTVTGTGGTVSVQPSPGANINVVRTDEYPQQFTYVAVGGETTAVVPAAIGAGAANKNVYPAYGIVNAATVGAIQITAKNAVSLTFVTNVALTAGDILNFLVVKTGATAPGVSVPPATAPVNVLPAPQEYAFVSSETGEISWVKTDVDFWVQLMNPGND